MNSCLYECTVMHRRLSPKRHEFVNRIFLFALDLDELSTLTAQVPIFSHNQPGLYNFRDDDHFQLTPGTARENAEAFLASHGITIDDGVEELPDETPPAGAERQRSVEVEDTEGLLARRLKRRKGRMSADGGSDVGNTADTVRMYLKEIGRVDLLSTDDERRLAQAIDELSLIHI